MDYKKLHKDTINRLQQMVNSGKITVETACGICADFEPESEDERIRKALINRIECFNEKHMLFNNGVSKNKVIAWLEKQGVQKPAEWSEEDERIVTELIGIFESAVDGGHVTFPYRLVKDYIRVLKLCLPQSAWKPSNEQMKYLSVVISNYDGDTYQHLKSLYNDLKKLREE